MDKVSVRWLSKTLLVKEGGRLVPRIFISGDYWVRGGKIKKGGDNDKSNNTNTRGSVDV